MKRWMAALPLAGLAGLAVLGASQLLAPEKPGFDEADKRLAPDRVFPRLLGQGELGFSPPPSGQTIAVNLFASWCAPCRAEHPLLIELAARNEGQVFGLAYKDTREDTLQFLDELGNPYADIGVDTGGQGGLDFGLTGVPETFIIDAGGMIVLHVRGPLDAQMMEDISGLLSE